ncbi:MAG: cobalt-factor II C(20)-methyltransferase [Enterobacteriaceae bacterium]|jgi:precorrin-2/cobalt-factor-2 C20-methyltransferase|nr:cobalt-factor II C(20)-methyltransferase [Enterobacteriaceae bacterium]
MSGTWLEEQAGIKLDEQAGRLYGIGVGPGAGDLITVRGARIISDLDVLYAPAGKKGAESLALTIVEEYLSPNTEIRTYHFLMNAEPEAKAAVWDEVAQALKDEVAKGHKVGFITLGDAMLFSTWVSLLERIGRQPWLEIVPGVTSFAAIAASSMMPLAMEAQSMAVISCTASEDELEQALRNHDCVVLMKVYGRLDRIRSLLNKLNLLDYALMMADATLPTEQCWRRLDKLEDGLRLPYFSTILVNKNWNTSR